jgi:hypothetical protein
MIALSIARHVAHMLDREPKMARETNKGKPVQFVVLAARLSLLRNAGRSRSVVKSTNSHLFA